MSVGSPPWNATTTSSTPRWAASSWAMYASCTSGGIRNPLPGYSSSLLRKKQYSQSRLQIAPVGLDITWKDRGAVSAVIARLPSSGSVEDEPTADLGLVIAVAVTGDVDDHLVDGATRERERRRVGG